MTASYPPPPPSASYAQGKVRPSVVTKYGIFTIVIGIVAIIIGVVDAVIFKDVAINVVAGAICIVIGVVFGLICGFGILAGQKWALIVSGYTMMAWTKNPEVIEYFGLSPASPVYPPSAPLPSTPMCSVCGRPLIYVQQYQRWYCQNCQRYS
jgi:hypothetical protein